MDLDGSGWNVVGMLLENVGDIDFQRDTLPTSAELFNTCWTDPSWAWVDFWGSHSESLIWKRTTPSWNAFDVVGMTGKGANVAFRLMTSKQTAWRVKFASHFGDSKPDICCFDPRSTQSSKSASTRASFGGLVTSDCPVRHYDPRKQYFRRMNIDLPADS